MNSRNVRFFSLLTAITIAFGVAPPVANSSEWIGGVGDWFEPANWNGGVPGTELAGEVNNGEAHFSSPVDVLQLRIATPTSINGNFASVARVVGTADLDVTSVAFIGLLNTRGIKQTDGLLTLNGGDLSSLRVIVGSANGISDDRFTANGGVQLIKGSLVSEDNVNVGVAGGTGSAVLTGVGDVRIEGGDLRAQGDLVIGDAGGTGSARATARGSVSVKGGNVEAARVRVGWATGTSSFNGDATGSLLVEDGDVETSNIWIGVTSAISQATGQSKAQFKIVDGDLSMTAMFVGQSDGGPSVGVFEQHRGLTSGGSLVVGAASQVILGINGTEAGVDYAQLRIEEVTIGGTLEARFAESFSPRPGMSFDLIVADSIAPTNLVVTGLDPDLRSAMRVVASPTLLRLVFVPETSSLALAATSLLGLSFSRRRRCRLHPAPPSATRSFLRAAKAVISLRAIPVWASTACMPSRPKRWRGLATPTPAATRRTVRHAWSLAPSQKTGEQSESRSSLPGLA